MPFEVAAAALEKYGAERDDAGGRVLQEVIPSTMGEPLLYSDFERLLLLCKGMGVKLNLTTNGTFPGKWGTPEGMRQLLENSRDIKISGLAFEKESGFSFDSWKANVERLIKYRTQKSDSTISLQMTLHKKNQDFMVDVLHWAESIGIYRIKWNPAVILSVASESLRREYELSADDLLALRETLKSRIVACEGSLFFARLDDQCSCSKDGRSENVCTEKNYSEEVCATFKDEIWILPDGSEQRCPNPERRFGNPLAENANCKNCPMRV